MKDLWHSISTGEGTVITSHINQSSLMIRTFKQLIFLNRISACN